MEGLYRDVCNSPTSHQRINLQSEPNFKTIFELEKANFSALFAVSNNRQACFITADEVMFVVPYIYHL